MSDDNTDQADESDDKLSLSEAVKDEVPDNPSMADHDSTAVGVVDELRDATVSIVGGTVLGVARVVPFSERFFRGLYAAGFKGLHKKSGCDYMGMIQVGGEIKPVPVNYDYEKSRFENRHGDWWKAPTEGE